VLFQGCVLGCYLTGVQQVSTKPHVSPERDTRYQKTSLPAPRRWNGARPGEVYADPSAVMFGTPGPDQGYVARLLPCIVGQLILPSGMEQRDASQAGISLACRRASLFGRAPMLEDLEVAFLLLGLMGETPGDWSTLAPVIAAAVEGAHYTPTQTEHFARAVLSEWLCLSPENLRQQLATVGPASAFSL